MPALLTAVLLLAACNLGDPVEVPDVGNEDTSIGSDGETDEADGTTVDGDVAPRPGPITLVVKRIEVLVDRPCDLDGDELADNAIADLGEPGASLVATGLSSGLDTSINRGNRWVFHIPLAEDTTVPEDSDVLVLTGEALDDDMCPETEGFCAHRVFDPSTWADDFSGEEGYWIRSESLDDCGEPQSVARDASIVGGAVDATFDRMVVEIPLTESRVWGTIAPGGASAELRICGAALAKDLGRATDVNMAGDLSFLELLSAGGLVYGIPQFPGLDPNLDFDGDGLERFRTDEEGHIFRCIDGDLTVIEGRDCWQDERIADGFGLSLRVELLSAVFLGRDPFWEQRACGPVADQMARDWGDEGQLGSLYWRACSPTQNAIDELAACASRLCSDECQERQWSPSCLICRDASCAAEMAACEAAVCCPSPPETSVFEPE